MADATLQHDSVQHGIRGEFEAPLFGAYSKKVGMWLFLASDSLTFGALLVAFSYNRISNPAWPTPFAKESIINSTIMNESAMRSERTMSSFRSAAEILRKAATSCFTNSWLTMVFAPRALLR